MSEMVLALNNSFIQKILWTMNPGSIGGSMNA